MRVAVLLVLALVACERPLPPNIGTSSKGTLGAPETSLEEQTAEQWARPWPERRGADGEDGFVTLAKAPVDDVARALARGGTWDADVLGRSVTVAQHYAFVVQLRGQAWTLVLAEDPALPPDLLSRALHADVVTLEERDGRLEYAAYADGARTEHVTARNGLVERFESPRLARADLERSGDLAGALMRSRDAYAPEALSSAYFFGDGDSRPDIAPGERRVVGNPGLVLELGKQRLRSTPEIDRVDYVAW